MAAITTRLRAKLDQAVAAKIFTVPEAISVENAFDAGVRSVPYMDNAMTRGLLSRAEDFVQEGGE